MFFVQNRTQELAPATCSTMASVTDAVAAFLASMRPTLNSAERCSSANRATHRLAKHLTHLRQTRWLSGAATAITERSVLSASPFSPGLTWHASSTALWTALTAASTDSHLILELFDALAGATASQAGSATF